MLENFCRTFFPNPTECHLVSKDGHLLKHLSEHSFSRGKKKKKKKLKKKTGKNIIMRTQQQHQQQMKTTITHTDQVE